MMRAVVMGVAGCGKSTVGAAAAQRLHATYLDGDDLHPQSNIDKMSAGLPLSDEDRGPWLDKIGTKLAQVSAPTLIGCSALRRVYRDRIRTQVDAPVFFLHLSGARSVIEGRMSVREGHFMPVSLLDSQFATLEPLQPDELGLVVDIDQEFDQVVAAVQRLGA